MLGNKILFPDMMYGCVVMASDQLTQQNDAWKKNRVAVSVKGKVPKIF